MVPNFQQEAHASFAGMVRDRRDFHRHPELGFQEVRTPGIVANRLDQIGLEVQRGVGQTGVVGLMEGSRPGPVVLMRFDMDALPITETNPVDYISRNPGVMHACGHDGHMAMGLTLAAIMSKFQPQMAGTLKFLFQPAEEGLGGALAVMADGALINPRPYVVLAMHLWNCIPLGRVRAAPGPAMASSSVFTITVKGNGGHGAAPHAALAPILAAAHIVAALQSIVSRNINPLESVVVTVSQMTAGTTFNVIPETAVFNGPVRSYEKELHHRVYTRILEMAQNMAAAFRCTATMETVAIVPAVVNDPEVAGIVKAAAANVVGQENVFERRMMEADDMGFILEDIPGCYFFIGSMNETGGDIHPQQHSQFDFGERAMVTGVATMARAAAHYVMPG